MIVGGTHTVQIGWKGLGRSSKDFAGLAPWVLLETGLNKEVKACKNTVRIIRM